MRRAGREIIRTEVVIIGSGPSGLLLHKAGIDTLIFEQKSKAYVLGRICAGVPEQGATVLIEETGAGLKMRCESLIHKRNEISFDGVRHRIDFRELTGKTVLVYGQTEVTLDLMDLREACNAPTVYEALDVQIKDIKTDHPRVSRTKGGQKFEAARDHVAGCDGFHGIGRQTIPADRLRTFERVYSFGWLGVLVDKPPVFDELIYVNRERGVGLP